MPKVTVLTSVYKSEKYIDGFLTNVRKQKFDNFQVNIEINEPSNEELNVINTHSEKYKVDKLINLGISEKLQTMSTSWNNCINNSDSEYICIWNVDDQRTKNSLKYMSDTLDVKKDIDIVYGHYYKVNKFKKKRGKLVDMSGQENLLRVGMIIGPFFMFRRSILAKSGLFDEQLYSGADYDFAMRILSFGKSYYIHKNLGYFLDEGLGASTRPNSKQEIERTVVELRYGIRVINKNLIIPASKQYDIKSLLFNNKKYNVKDYFGND